MNIPALLSVHDITPETIPRLTEMVDIFDDLDICNVSLLLIPVSTWEPDQISYIKRLGKKGYQLAGHGWRHHCFGAKDTFHRIHAALFSRNAAEHYSCKTPKEIKKIIKQCYRWFKTEGLGCPRYYVAPAWAMGKIVTTELRGLPFRWYEFLSGVYDSRTDRFYRIPLMGFEADTVLRALFLKIFNYLNYRIALIWKRPYRIAIHPNDFNLKLKSDLLALLASQKRFAAWENSFTNPHRIPTVLDYR